MLTELLAQAGLAQSELAKERVKADRDARLAQTWASLVPQTIDAGTRVAEGVGKAQDAEASRLVSQLKDYTGQGNKQVRIDPERGPIGELAYATPAEQEAQKLVAERVKDPLNDFLGIAKGYKQAVREKALAGLAANIGQNRKSAQAAAQAEAKSMADWQGSQRQEGREDRKILQTDERIRQDQLQAEAQHLAAEERLKQEQALRRELAGQNYGLRRDQMQQQMSEAEKNRELQRELARMRAEQRPAAKQPEPRQAEAKPKADGAPKEPAAQTKKSGRMLSAAVIADIAGFDGAVSAVDKIMAEKPRIDTGRLRAIGNSVAKPFGLDDPKVTGFRGDVGDQIAGYIKGISGAGVSDKERAFLLSNLPTFEDDDKQFTEKLQRVRARLLLNRDSLVNANKAAGYEVGTLPDIRPKEAPKPDINERVDQLLAEDKTLTDEELQKILEAEGIE